MNILTIVDLNIFSLLICTGMYVVNVRMSEKSMVQNRIFRYLLLSTMVLLALEAAIWFSEGQPEVFMRVFNNAGNALLFALTPLPATLWALYSSYLLFHSMRRLKTEILLYSLPVVINAILSIASPFTGWMFSIDSANIYHRGPLYMIMAVISMTPLLLMLIMYIVMRKNISRKLFIPTLLFAVAPAVGAVFQMLFYGITVIWSSITVSIFIVHTGIQSRHFYLDHLTGVFNRRQLDNHMHGRMQAATRGKKFCFIMLDIDNFKSINDTFGHVTGDQALADAAKILTSCIRSSDFLARYAGDEFVIIIDIGEESVVRQTIDRIKEKTAAFNHTGGRPYILSFSIGYKTYSHALNVTRDEFVTHVDSLMYQDKYRKKYSVRPDMRPDTVCAYTE